MTPSPPDPKTIVPVILAGGEGRRLRPLTSPTHPKPFLKVASKQSLLQNTLHRVAPFAPPILILNTAHKDTAAAQAAQINAPLHAIICEPVNRSTAAAIAMAAFHLKGQNTLMAIMPSDHAIENTQAFQSALKQAATDSLTHDTVTIIAAPAYSPSPRFGYISITENRITSFIEKPMRSQAKDLIAAGACHWNTGIFTCTPTHFLSLLKDYAPDIYSTANTAYQTHKAEAEYLFLDQEVYTAIPAMPVDIAIMEHLTEARCVPLQSRWYDLGTWPTLLEVVFKTALRAIHRI